MLGWSWAPLPKLHQDKKLTVATTVQHHTSVQTCLVYTAAVPSLGCPANLSMISLHRNDQSQILCKLMNVYSRCTVMHVHRHALEDLPGPGLRASRLTRCVCCVTRTHTRHELTHSHTHTRKHSKNTHALMTHQYTESFATYNGHAYPLETVLGHSYSFIRTPSFVLLTV